jgi:ABC-type lipopolysaccharide export system ATPase subunit
MGSVGQGKVRHQVITFKQFLSESPIPRSDIQALRQKMGQQLKAGRAELARRLRVAPSSVVTHMPRASVDAASAETTIYVSPSAASQKVGLGLDWFDLNTRRVEALVRDIYARPFGELGYRIVSVDGTKRSWEYGKVTHQLLIDVRMEKQ